MVFTVIPLKLATVVNRATVNHVIGRPASVCLAEEILKVGNVKNAKQTTTETRPLPTVKLANAIQLVRNLKDAIQQQVNAFVGRDLLEEPATSVRYDKLYFLENGSVKFVLYRLDTEM